MSQERKPDPISCMDKCGATVADEKDAENNLWTWLPVARAYRCPACRKAMERAGKMTGSTLPSTFVDKLPPDSIGSLRKPTAESILPPSVKP